MEREVTGVDDADGSSATILTTSAALKSLLQHPNGDAEVNNITRFVTLDWPDPIDNQWNCFSVEKPAHVVDHRWWRRGVQEEGQQSYRCMWEWEVFFPLAECDLNGHTFFCPQIAEIVLFTWYERWWRPPSAEAVQGYLGEHGNELQAVATEPVPQRAFAGILTESATAATATKAAQAGEESTASRQ